MKTSYESISIEKFEDGRLYQKEDFVINEFALDVYINGSLFVTMMCTPELLEELVVGYLHSEGIIQKYTDVQKIRLNLLEKKVYIETEEKDTFHFSGDNIQAKKIITTACGKNRTVNYYLMQDNIVLPQENDYSIDYTWILSIAKKFNRMSELFIKTGGVHSCIFINAGKEELLVEDIGRHNCVDKIIGYILTKNIRLEQPIVFTSGRVSSDMIYKVIKANIGCIVSKSAPTNLGIELAKKFNVKLIGFARGNKLNIYN